MRFLIYFITNIQAIRKPELSNVSMCDLRRHNTYLTSLRMILTKQRLFLQKSNLTSIFTLVTRRKPSIMVGFFFVCLFALLGLWGFVCFFFFFSPSETVICCVAHTIYHRLLSLLLKRIVPSNKFPNFLSSLSLTSISISIQSAFCSVISTNSS